MLKYIDFYFVLFQCVSTIYMFGIVAFGSKQYKIVPSEACIFERLEGNVGDKVSFNNLVLLSDNEDVVLEATRLKKYRVNGTIVKQFRENKVISFKKKRRKDYTRTRGHRQYKTLVLIDSIDLEG